MAYLDSVTWTADALITNHLGRNKSRQTALQPRAHANGLTRTATVIKMGPHLWTFKKDKVAIEGVFLPADEVWWNIPRICQDGGAEVLPFLSFENPYFEKIEELQVTEEWFYISRGTDSTISQPINRNTKSFGTGFPEAIISYTRICSFRKIDHASPSERFALPLLPDTRIMSLHLFMCIRCMVYYSHCFDCGKIVPFRALSNIPT